MSPISKETLQKTETNYNHKEPELSGWYGPPNGLDVMGALIKLKTRSNPVVDIGPIDLTYSFLITDLSVADHPIVYGSATFEQLTGYTWDDFIGKNCRFLQDPKGKCEKGSTRRADNDVIYAMKKCIDCRSEGQFCLTNYRKDGTPFQNLVTLIPISMNNTGVYTHYVGLQMDLLKKLAKLTTESRINTTSTLPFYNPKIKDKAPVSRLVEGYAQSYVDTSSTLVHIVSLRGAILYASPDASKKLLGYDAEELKGKSLANFMNADDFSFVMRQFKVATDKTHLCYLCRMKRKDDQYVYMDVRGHVTGKKRTRCFILSARENSLANFSISHNSIPASDFNDEIWIRISPHGLILFTTSTFMKIFGVDPNGHTIFEIFHPDFREPLSNAINSIVAQNGISATSESIPCTFNNRGTPLHGFVQFIGSSDRIGNTLYAYIRFFEKEAGNGQQFPIFESREINKTASISYEINSLRFENKALNEAIKKYLDKS